MDYVLVVHLLYTDAEVYEEFPNRVLFEALSLLL